MKKMRKFIACASFKIHKIGIYQSDKFKFVFLLISYYTPKL